MNNKLTHHGILGMKWGIRRDNSSGGSGSSTLKTGSKKIMKPIVNIRKTTSPRSEDSIKKDTLKVKRLSEMTNVEIRQLNERLQLERQYKELTRAEASPGRKFVTDVLTSAAKQTATSYVTKYMGKGVDEVVKRIIK